MRQFEHTQMTCLRQEPFSHSGGFDSFANPFRKPQVPNRQFGADVRLDRRELCELIPDIVLNAIEFARLVCYQLRGWNTFDFTPMPTFGKYASYNPFNSGVLPRRARVRSVKEYPFGKWFSEGFSKVRRHHPNGSLPYQSVDITWWNKKHACTHVCVCVCVCYRRMIKTMSRSMI